MKGILYFVAIFVVVLVVGKTTAVALHWVFNSGAIIPIVLAFLLALLSWSRTNRIGG